MRHYETVFILRPDLGEAQIKESTNRFGQIVGSGGGELVETDEWGVRELAYNIKRERRGYYVRFDYVASAAVVNELERNLRLADNVLRYLSVLVDIEANPAELRSEVEARKRKLEEAKAPAPAPAPAAEAPVAAVAEAPAAETPEPAPPVPEDGANKS